MKFRSSLPCLILGITASLLVKAQTENIHSEIRKYKAKLVTQSGKKHKGMIINMTADSVIIGPSWKTFHYTDITSIQLQKKGHTAKKMILWGSIATAAGGLMGLVAFNDPVTRALGVSGLEIFAIYGGVSMPLGVGTGYLISRKGRHKFYIGSDQEKWLMIRELFFHTVKEENNKPPAIPVSK